MKVKKSKVNRIVNVAIIALIGYVVVSLFVLQADISSRRRQLSVLEEQCQEQQLENQELDNLMERDSDFEYIVKMAREKLGLVFPEEHIFYDASGNQ
ncbi:MAG: septum formation initiator family protein [Candidatus Merdivicinus sp.]|jgi:cell division protein FtsB